MRTTLLIVFVMCNVGCEGRREQELRNRDMAIDNLCAAAGGLMHERTCYAVDSIIPLPSIPLPSITKRD